MVHHYIYVITKKDTGHYYIGMRSSKDEPESDGYFGSGYRIRYAVKKYGRAAFEKSILFLSESREELAALESSVVTSAELDDPLCYNLIRGGVGVGSYGTTYNFSETHRANISAAKKGQPVSDEIRAAMSVRRKGIKQRPETVAKRSAALRGKPRSEEARRAISASHSGRKFSDEHKASLKKAWEQRTISKEQRENMIAGQREAIASAKRGS